MILALYIQETHRNALDEHLDLAIEIYKASETRRVAGHAEDDALRWRPACLNSSFAVSCSSCFPPSRGPDGVRDPKKCASILRKLLAWGQGAASCRENPVDVALGEMPEGS